MINTIILGHVLNVLPKLPAESFNCVTCSPPYWGLRDYGIEPVIWDGDKDCKHIWKTEITKRPNASGGKTDWAKEKLAIKGVENYQEFVDYHERETTSDFCLKCGAWKGSLGLEPTFELYIKHLCDIFDEIKRVLRKDGCIFVNLGDTYNSHSAKSKNVGGFEGKQMRNNKAYSDSKIAPKKEGVPDKSLCCIPDRFNIEMVNRGWIKRNTIIWHKPNCMPSSAPDRFTVDFEYLFYFTKNNKTLFWTNEKTLECVSKKPSGTKGIEGKDWEWRKCPNCQGEGTIVGKALKEGAAPIVIGNGIVTKNTKAFKVCPRCKGSGKVKYSFWSGHDYWFEQQFEEYAPDTLPRMDRGVNVNKWTLGADGQTPHNLSQPRLRKERGYKTKQMDKEIHRQQHHGKDINYGRYGRNKRCVWKIPTKSFKEAHFAVYPETLIEPIIKAGCPEFICKKCGKARVKIYKETKTEPIEIYNGQATKNYSQAKAQNPSDTKRRILESMRTKKEEIGYSDCGCNAGWEGGIVLDPFMGAGTTAVVARKQGKQYIGIEIKQEYIDMSNKRTRVIPGTLF